ncbi:hypothetical protein ABW19_dt0207333 [Dactylella cylindrospora]|nr:hypothetical protein ABW19_dt0207333 [Dactylella cylindrospora]
MTRTTKANDIPHNNPDAAATMLENQMPKFFAKTGFVDVAPSKTKKDGGGKGNWGHPGDEIEEDLDEFNMTRVRRRSNSFHNSKWEMKSKFEVNEEEPFFDEDRHGPLPEDRVQNSSSSSEATPDSAAAGGSGSGEAIRS